MARMPADKVTFQDSLFSAERVVQRVLPGGTRLQLTLEPLAGGRVRVLAYQRQRAGERWQTVREEEGRTLAFDQLGLPGSFADLFGVEVTGALEARPSGRRKRRR